MVEHAQEMETHTRESRWVVDKIGQSCTGLTGTSFNTGGGGGGGGGGESGIIFQLIV